VSTQRFPIRVGRKSRIPLRVFFGVTPENAWVELGDAPDGIVHVSFGRFGFETRLDNVVSWRIEGPWLWITAIGVRTSLRHRDVSFDGSPHGGVRLDFGTPVRWAFFHVPAIYVSADDLDALAAALQSRGIPGADARRSS
jgi:hypothetical protein